MDLPSVSIITVALNNSRYIEETIRSVLAQTYSDIEYIVIDGASTDGTVEIIGRYADRFASWLSEPDEGIADAFNKGLARSTGDYVLFLNSDDYFAVPEAVELAMHAAQASRMPEIVFGNCQIIDRETGHPVRRLDFGWSPLAFRLGRMVNHPALFAHRSYFDRHGVFDTTFRIAMDFELLSRGILKSRVLHVPHLFTCMRSGGTSMQSRQRVVEEILRAMKKNALIKTQLSENLLRCYFGCRKILRPLKFARQ